MIILTWESCRGTRHLPLSYLVYLPALPSISLPAAPALDTSSTDPGHCDILPPVSLSLLSLHGRSLPPLTAERPAWSLKNWVLPGRLGRRSAEGGQVSDVPAPTSHVTPFRWTPPHLLIDLTLAVTRARDRRAALLPTARREARPHPCRGLTAHDLARSVALKRRKGFAYRH